MLFHGFCFIQNFPPKPKTFTKTWKKKPSLKIQNHVNPITPSPPFPCQLELYNRHFCVSRPKFEGHLLFGCFAILASVPQQPLLWPHPPMVQKPRKIRWQKASNRPGTNNNNNNNTTHLYGSKMLHTSQKTYILPVTSLWPLLLSDLSNWDLIFLIFAKLTGSF